jgi:hypothetical protein
MYLRNSGHLVLVVVKCAWLGLVCAWLAGAAARYSKGAVGGPTLRLAGGEAAVWEPEVELPGC